MDLIDRILSRENMLRALKAVKKNKGAAGIDKVTVEELDELEERKKSFGIIAQWTALQGVIAEEKKNNNSSRSYQDAGCFIAGGLSIIGFIFGGALAEIEGAIGGLILGLIVGYYIGNRWEKRK